MYEVFLHMQHGTKHENCHGFCTMKINMHFCINLMVNAKVHIMEVSKHLNIWF